MYHPIPGRPTSSQAEALLKPFGTSFEMLKLSRLRIAIRLYESRAVPAAICNVAVGTVTLMPEIVFFDFSENPLIFGARGSKVPPDCPELKGRKIRGPVRVVVTELYRKANGEWSAHFRCGEGANDAGDFKKSISVTVTLPVSA